MRPTLARVAACAALSMLTLLPATGRAAVLVALDLTQLVDGSDYVVVAHPQGESARYANGLIVTDVRLRVVTALKGPAKPGDVLVATHLGGAIDRVGLTVPGAARFTPGQSALVFLRRAPGSHDLNVTGMSQGVLPIVGDGPDAQVRTQTDGATLMQRDASGALVPATDATGTRTRSLSSTIAEIERIVAGTH